MISFLAVLLLLSVPLSLAKAPTGEDVRATRTALRQEQKKTFQQETKRENTKSALVMKESRKTLFRKYRREKEQRKTAKEKRMTECIHEKEIASDTLFLCARDLLVQEIKGMRNARRREHLQSLKH